MAKSKTSSEPTEVTRLKAALKQLQSELHLEKEWRDAEINRLLKKLDRRDREVGLLSLAASRLRDHYNREIDRLEDRINRMR